MPKGTRALILGLLAARGDLEAPAASHDVPLTYLRVVGGDRLRLGPHIDLPVSELAHAYEEGLPRALKD